MVSALELQSGEPGFESRFGHLLDLFSICSSSIRDEKKTELNKHRTLQKYALRKYRDILSCAIATLYNFKIG